MVSSFPMLQANIDCSMFQNCRETHGESTCDKRKPKTYIASSFPRFVFEEGFTEFDELWDPTTRESTKQVAERARKVLDVIFQKDIDAQCKIQFRHPRKKKSIQPSTFFFFLVSCFHHSS